MPDSRRTSVFAVAALLALLTLSAVPVTAQAQGGLSVWLGAGRPITRDSIPRTLKNLDAYGALQLDVPLLPVGLRADVSVGSADFSDGQRNATASLILPLRLPFVQPYGMLGYGVYDWGKAREERGISYGAGVRVHVSRLGVFAQVRRHEPLKRTLATVGMTF